MGTIEIKLGEVKQDVNRASTTGEGNLRASISYLERAAASQHTGLDLDAGYSFLSVRWEVSRRKALASISRIGGDAVLLSLRDEKRTSDREWDEGESKLHLDLETGDCFAVAEGVSYWPPQHASMQRYRGDEVAEFSLTKILQITPESIRETHIVPIELGAPARASY